MEVRSELMMITSKISWIRLAQLVAISCGRTITQDEADYILWEYTGFPSFWPGKPISSCIKQLQDFFNEGPDAVHLEG